MLLYYRLRTSSEFEQLHKGGFSFLTFQYFTTLEKSYIKCQILCRAEKSFLLSLIYSFISLFAPGEVRITLAHSNPLITFLLKVACLTDVIHPCAIK